jgi:hypothetical protein
MTIVGSRCPSQRLTTRWPKLRKPCRLDPDLRGSAQSQTGERPAGRSDLKCSLLTIASIGHALVAYQSMGGGRDGWVHEHGEEAS